MVKQIERRLIELEKVFPNPDIPKAIRQAAFDSMTWDELTALYDAYVRKENGEPSTKEDELAIEVFSEAWDRAEKEMTK